MYATSSGISGDALRAYAYGASCYGVNAFSDLSFGVYVSTGNSSSYAGYFSGNVYSSGVYSGSDQKLKQNITGLNNAMAFISKLQPKVYEYRQDGNYKLMNLPLGKRYGLIAQDVEEVLPGLVKQTAFNTAKANGQGDEDNKGETINFKAVNYTELIPIMIKAMQEQAEQMQVQQNEITALKAENKQMKQDMQHCFLNHSTGNAQDKLQQHAGEKALLEQNAPNPFTEQTVIRFYIPVSAKSAVMKILDARCKELKSLSINERGASQISISANTLAPGVYTYTLIVDDKEADVRQMIVTK